MSRSCSAALPLTRLQFEALWRTDLMKLPHESLGGAVGARSFGGIYVAIDSITYMHVAGKRYNKFVNPEAWREFTIHALLMNYPCFHFMALTNGFLDRDILLMSGVAATCGVTSSSPLCH